MAATHTYVVTSAKYIPGSLADPLVTIVGSVDGVAVTVTINLSLIVAANTSGGISAVEALVAGIMLPQAILNSPATFVSAQTAPAQLPTGTFVL